MEEKERFEIHIYDDVCVDLYNNGVLDKSINDTYKLEKLLNQQDEQIADLEAKLAEKDKEIEQLKKFDDLNKTFFDLFRTAFKKPDKVDDLFNTLKTIQEKQDQDKISFAIEQLTLFKNSIVNKMNNPYSVNIKHILSDFDNQIKELKGRN